MPYSANFNSYLGLCFVIGTFFVNTSIKVVESQTRKSCKTAQTCNECILGRNNCAWYFEGNPVIEPRCFSSIATDQQTSFPHNFIYDPENYMKITKNDSKKMVPEAVELKLRPSMYNCIYKSIVIFSVKWNILSEIVHT